MTRPMVDVCLPANELPSSLGERGQIRRNRQFCAGAKNSRRRDSAGIEYYR